MHHMIYVPRVSVDMLRSPLADLRNPSVCVKIPYMGYEISIAMDSSHGSGDLCRSDIRVFDGEQEITDKIVSMVDPCAGMLYGDAETLKAVFGALDHININS